MRILRLIPLAVAVTLCLSAAAQDDPQPSAFIPGGSFSAGAQIAYAQLDSDNSEIFLLVNPVTARGSATLVAPFAEYSYRDDRSIGLRLSYLGASARLDDLTLDLLNEGLQFSVSDMSARLNSFGGALYHRNYFGIDRRNRLAAFAEFALSLSGGRSDFGSDGEYSSSFKAGLSFSPGLMFFIMNNVAASCSVSMGGLSYNSVKCYSDGTGTGHRSKFGSRFGLDLLGINFGVSFHF